MIHAHFSSVQWLSIRWCSPASKRDVIRKFAYELHTHTTPGLYKSEHNAARSSRSGEPVEGAEGEPDGGSADGARSTDGGRSSELVQSGAVSVGQSGDGAHSRRGKADGGRSMERKELGAQVEVEGRGGRVAEWSRDAEKGSGAGQRAEWRPPLETGRSGGHSQEAFAGASAVQSVNS